ncbi:MAG: ATP-binding protein [Acidimicrobiaceae bacterium]|nr:ATP-binding protein [Acidimicrobiaceae bacterium]MYD08273.1 ATP-binding protein [Acidimicrobiaceae bacterium]MYI58706.1 ATP-binding protein [Acidimicrobiaceae bacterium]
MSNNKYRRRSVNVGWQPQPSDYQRVFSEQNSWQSSGAVPEALAPSTERSLASVLWQRLIRNDPRRHQVILGPRRVGKTTVLYQTVQHLIENSIDPKRIWWLRMDHPLLIEVSLGDLVRSMLNGSDADDDNPLFVMLDEVVYARDWDLWLKTFYDENWPVRIAATSSATAGLRKQRRESGVGRWEEHQLMPCQLDEFLNLLGLAEEPEAFGTLAERLGALGFELPMDPVTGLRTALLLVGGFPELLLKPFDPDKLELHVLESQRVLRSDAVERAVYKDIPQTSGVDNPLMLERLLYALAGQVTGILSPTGIGKDLGIAQPTFDRYLSYLEQAYLIFPLTNYSGSEQNVQRRGRKLYFVDSAVRNAALHRGLAPLSDPVEQGLLLENLVASAVNTLAAHAGVRLHHWRDGNREVDLIYDDPRQPLAFEIASSPSHGRSGLAALIERHPHFRGHSYLIAPQAGVIHPSEEASGIGTLPVDTFLLAVGAQSHQAMLNRLGVTA